MEKQQKNTKDGKDRDKSVKKKKSRFFENYISKLLKNISTDSGITSNAKQQLNNAICIITSSLSERMLYLVQNMKKKTLSDKEVCVITKLFLPKDLSEISIKRAEEAVQNFSEQDMKHSSRQNKAGIFFPPSVVEKFMRNFGYYKIMLTSSAPIFFATVLECITEDILVLAVKSSREHNRVRITIRDLELSVKKDNELSQLLDRLRITFIGGGVLPYVHSALTAKKKRKKKKKPTGHKPKKHYLPGTVAIREIRKLQKTSNCLTLAKLPFERLIRSIVEEHQTDMKISKNVFIIIQYYIEQFLINFLKDANAVAVHSGRVKLIPSDITFISKLRRRPVPDFTKFEKKEQYESEHEEDNNNQI